MSKSPHARHDPAEETLALPLLLQTGMGLCFIGHGAFGLLTKAAWLPYFNVVGIGESTAWELMPWVGAMDIAIGFLAMMWPTRALFAWAACWAIWTALLRPLAGQGWPEFFERAGNYGVPLAALIAVGWNGSWWRRLSGSQWETPLETSRRQVEWTLRLVVATLLAGHAGCALLLKKAALAQHYLIFSPQNQTQVMAFVGWMDLALAASVLVFKSRAIFIFVCCWKLANESLFLTSGTVTPMFELIERGGSYIAPLALAVLVVPRSSSPRSPVGGFVNA